MERYQIKINRHSALESINRENWKDAISAIVMLGYNVYADEDNIVFELSPDDEVRKIETKV